MDNFAILTAEQTQSELKPGWIVFDIKLKDKLIHYLSGGSSSQLTDDNMPEFHIVPAEHEVLADYAKYVCRKRNTTGNYQKTKFWKTTTKRWNLRISLSSPMETMGSSAIL